MAYSLSLLTTPAECDAVQALIDDALKMLRHQEENIDYQRDNTTESATEGQAEMASLDAEITSLNTLIPTLAVGTARKKREVELRKAVYRRAHLTDMQALRGAVALIKREMALAQVQVQIDELTDLTAQVATRKAAL